MAEIIPGILEKDWASIEKKLEQILPFAKTVQIDIIDGKFASNSTLLDLTPLKKYADKIFFEAHLMVEEPIGYIEKLASFGFKRFIGHVEKMSSQQDFLNIGKRFGEVGLAIDAFTTLDEIKVDINFPDCFLVMSVKTGFSGQPFLKEVLGKIKELKEKTAQPIEVDGGINGQIIPLLKALGVARYVVTSDLFKSEDVEQEYQRLTSLIA